MPSSISDSSYSFIHSRSLIILWNCCSPSLRGFHPVEEMGLPPPPGLPPCRAALTVAGLGPSWREAAASATATAAYMAANTRPNLGTTVATNLKSAANNGGAVSGSLDHASVFATASVGRGDWASEVLQNVVGGETETETAAPVTSPPTAPPPAPPPLSAEEQLKQVLLQKKRLFHSNRCLELKNLPEGVTEQVRTEEIFQKKKYLWFKTLTAYVVALNYCNYQIEEQN